jgi:hypothetical protein
MPVASAARAGPIAERFKFRQEICQLSCCRQDHNRLRHIKLVRNLSPYIFSAGIVVAAKSARKRRMFHRFTTLVCHAEIRAL